MSLSRNLIAEVLKQGYTVKEYCDDGSIIVNDPVMCSSGGGRKWTEYRPVHIKTDKALHKFLNGAEG